MKKFVVGFISFFDNDLKLEIVFANSEVDALKNSSFVQGYEFPDNASVDDIQSVMFDCDSSISVLEISDPAR